MGLHVPFNNCELHTRTHHPQSKNRNNEALKLRVSLSRLSQPFSHSSLSTHTSIKEKLSQKLKNSKTLPETENFNAHHSHSET